MTNKKAVFVLNVKLTVISILIDVCLRKCVAYSTFSSAQRRVFILSWPLAQETHSVFLSLHQKIAELLWGSPLGVGLLLWYVCAKSDSSIASLSFPPCACQCVLRCGSMQSLCFRYLTWLPSALGASLSTTTAAPSSSNHCFAIENYLLSLPHEAWNTSFYIGIGRYLNFWSDPDCAH